MKIQNSPPTYGDLYAYLNNRIENKKSAEPFHLVQQFSALHGFDANGIIPILEGFGGYDDHEVLFNVIRRIPAETAIGSDVETAEQVARRKGFYCRWADGQWNECSAEHPDAMPDLNRALFELMKAHNTP
jgi:hypothetical protein